MENKITDVFSEGHRGNPNLKRIGEQIEWDQEKMSEYLKCSKDPIYFIKNYVKIINVDEGLVDFDMYDYQEQMITEMKENRRTIITTARQTGKSTTTCAFILWYVLFEPHKTVGILANKGNTAREILGKVKFAYEHLPKWLQQGIVEWHKGAIELENDSRVIAEATSATAVRGFSLNLLFLDEAAFIENWDEFSKSVMPTITSGKTTKIIMVSTPNGMNHFYFYWQNALEGSNGYSPIKVHWKDVPGRDEEWKKETLAALNFDEQKFKQENECEFYGSSGTLIAGWKLQIMKSKVSLVSDNIYMNQYERCKKDHVYIMSVDVSRGKGLDYNAFQIIDVTSLPYEQVCTYRCNTINPVDFTDVIYQMANYYNKAQILVEINDIGGQVVDILFDDLECENVLHTKTKGRKGKVITFESGQGIDRGIRTTEHVKTVGCSLLKMLIEQDKLIINDSDTIAELSTFSMKGKTYQAEPGKHDDLTMCLVLFGWLTGQEFFKDLSDVDLMKALRENSEDQLFDQLVSFGVSNHGVDDEEMDFNDPLTIIDEDEYDRLLATNW